MKLLLAAENFLHSSLSSLGWKTRANIHKQQSMDKQIPLLAFFARFPILVERLQTERFSV